MDIFRIEGANYVTFNIPYTECKSCKHIVAAPVKECPKCGSKKVSYWTRIIGYVVEVGSWGWERQLEFLKRVYSKYAKVC